MKIRIEISQGSMDYVMDREVMDIHPALIRDCIHNIEEMANNCAPDVKTCINCKHWVVDQDEDPCESCLESEESPDWEPVDN